LDHDSHKKTTVQLVTHTEVSWPTTHDRPTQNKSSTRCKIREN